MTGKIKGADKMREAIGGMTAAFKGVSEAALAAAEANLRFDIAASWGKSVSDYARFGMDPSKSPSFTAISVSRPRESAADGFVSIQPSRHGKTAYFERRIAELEEAGEKVTRITPEMLQRHAVKVRETYDDFVERAFGASTAQEPEPPVSGETIIENIRAAIADAVENGTLAPPGRYADNLYGRYQPFELDKEKWDRTRMYLASYPLHFCAPRGIVNLDPGAGEFPTLSVTLPDTPRGRRAVAMWLREPIDRRRRKRAVRILRHELKLAAEARFLWS